MKCLQRESGFTSWKYHQTWRVKPGCCGWKCFGKGVECRGLLFVCEGTPFITEECWETGQSLSSPKTNEGQHSRTSTYLSVSCKTNSDTDGHTHAHANTRTHTHTMFGCFSASSEFRALALWNFKENWSLNLHWGRGRLMEFKPFFHFVFCFWIPDFFQLVQPQKWKCFSLCWKNQVIWIFETTEETKQDVKYFVVVFDP